MCLPSNVSLQNNLGLAGPKSGTRNFIWVSHMGKTQALGSFPLPSHASRDWKQSSQFWNLHCKMGHWCHRWPLNLCPNAIIGLLLSHWIALSLRHFVTITLQVNNFESTYQKGTCDYDRYESTVKIPTWNEPFENVSEGKSKIKNADCM